MLVAQSNIAHPSGFSMRRATAERVRIEVTRARIVGSGPSMGPVALALATLVIISGTSVLLGAAAAACAVLGLSGWPAAVVLVGSAGGGAILPHTLAVAARRQN